MDRLAGRLQRKARRRFGPDLIHVGLLVLILGALLSTWGRREGTFYLGLGDSIDLPWATACKLLEYVDQRYEDGRPGTGFPPSRPAAADGCWRPPTPSR